MSRIRTKGLASGDGGAFGKGNRPPADRLPEAFKAPLAEYDDIMHRLGEAKQALSNFTEPSIATAALDKARRADAAASAESARQGTIVSTTEHVDALHAAERQARADVEALEGALKLVLDDLASVRDAERANLPNIEKAEATARARLVKATEQAVKAADEVAAQIALREWVTEHLPWDASTSLSILDIWAPAARTVSAQDKKLPVTFRAVTDALNNL